MDFVRDTLRDAWGDFARHWQTLLLAGFVRSALLCVWFLALTAALSVLQGLSPLDPLAFLGFSSLNFLTWFLGLTAGAAFLYLGYVGLCLEVARGGTPRLRHLFGETACLMPGWIATFLVAASQAGLCIALSPLPLLGEVLAVAGCAALAVLTCLTPFFIVDRHRAALTALSASARAVLRQPGSLALLCLACGLITALASALPVVGSLAGMALTTLAMARGYVRLQKA